MFVPRSVRVAVSALALGLGATGANAQQILSALNTDADNVGLHVDLVARNAGEEISYAYQGNLNRAVTSYGVNKIFANAAGNVEQSTTSAWLDTYTAGGVAGSKVRLSFTFSIDGSARFGSYATEDAAPDYNFKVYALRGTGWQMYGTGNSVGNQFYPAFGAGDDYDSLFLQRISPTNTVQQIDMLGEQRLVNNYANNGGQPGSFAGQGIYDPAQDVYKSTTINAQGFPTTGYFYKDFYRSGTPSGPVSPPIPYNGTSPQASALRQARANFETNFVILDIDQLCSEDAGSCIGRDYEPTPMTLSFELNAGDQFTLAAWLYSDYVNNATIDFFNTAKVSSITAVDSATGAQVSLTSDSGTLTSLPGGGFGYPAPNAAVPEPASWAMMIGGFGLVGGAMRRRRTGAAALA